MLPEIAKDIQVERKAPNRIIGLHAPLDHIIHVSLGDFKGTRDFLGRRRTGFANVITADTDRIAAWEFLGRIFNTVAHQSDRIFHRIYPGPATDHFFENIILGCGTDFFLGVAEFFRRGLIHGQHNGRHGINGEP